jgi:hypothetical protein
VNGYGDYKDRRKTTGGYAGDERRGHETCQLVIEHHAQLAQMSADIAHIKRKIDNGLTEKMDSLNNRLDALDRDSWVTQLLSGGVKKLIGLIIFLILANALANNAILALVRISQG